VIAYHANSEAGQTDSELESASEEGTACRSAPKG